MASGWIPLEIRTAERGKELDVTLPWLETLRMEYDVILQLESCGEAALPWLKRGGEAGVWTQG
jgi:hypothetical protein